MALTYGSLGMDIAENAGLTIDIYSVLLGTNVTFRALLTDYSDKYETSWESESVYGRMDDIQTYSGTKRSVSIGWEVVAAHEDEGKANLHKCTHLFAMLYPSYDTGGGSSGLKGPPLFKIKFTNLLMDAQAAGSEASPHAKDTGLLGTISGFTFEPDLDAGMFVPSAGILYPKVLKLSCDFNVLHTHELGWDELGAQRSGFDHFPWGEGNGGNEATSGGWGGDDSGGASTDASTEAAEDEVGGG